MTIRLTYHGHAALGLDISGTHVLVDPFLSDNPSATVGPAELPADFILVSHGHSDHVGDTVAGREQTASIVGRDLVPPHVASRLAVERDWHAWPL